MTVLYRKKPDDSYPAFLRNSSAMMYSARRFLPFLCIIDDGDLCADRAGSFVAVRTKAELQLFCTRKI